MNSKQLDRHFKAAINYLDYHYAYFLTNVIRIGRPRWTTEIPTAAVGNFTRPGDKLPNLDEENFEFVFNPEFASTLDVPGFAFVIAHETMHIILNHLKLAGTFVDKDRYKELSAKMEKGERLTRSELKEALKMQQAAAKFNIAADCVINDYLSQAGMPVWDSACRGEDIIGEDAAFLTVTDVFERLPEPPKGDDGEGEDGEGQGGTSGYDRGDKADSHSWMFDPNFADDVADAIDKMNEEIEKSKSLPNDLRDKRVEESGEQTDAQKQLANSMRAGSEEGNMREFQEQSGLQMAWVKLLKEVDPDMFKEPGIGPAPMPAWHKHPRKLGAFPGINLPVYKTNPHKERRSIEKPAIVMALDYSGSIGPQDADRFATLARSIPTDRIKLFCCTFTTTYKRFDLENPHGGGSGGTDFDPIAQFIDNEVIPELNGQYPKAVIVITDGEASMSRVPTDEQAQSWYWLISPMDRARGMYRASLDIGRRAMLTEFIA